MEEEVICSECAAEAPDGESEMQLQLDGWDFTGEYGARCPECVATNMPIEPVEGISQLADVVGAKLKEE